MDLEKLKDKIEEKSFNVEDQAGNKMIVVELVDVCDVIDAVVANSSNDIQNVSDLLISFAKEFQDNRKWDVLTPEEMAEIFLDE